MKERHRKLLEQLQHGKLDLKETARTFGVTEMTLRRDFRELEERKLLLQVKGGAIPYPVRCEPENETFQLNDAKNRIAERLYTRIMPTRTIFLGAGSTSFAFAKLLSVKNPFGLTVITNSIPAAAALFRSNCTVLLPGGELRTDSLDLVGPITEKNLEEYHVDWLVSGCDGAFADQGFYTSDSRLSDLEKKSIGIAEHVAVITETAKFGHRSFVRFAKPGEVDLLVTERPLAPKDAILLREAGIELLSALRT